MLTSNMLFQLKEKLDEFLSQNIDKPRTSEAEEKAWADLELISKEINAKLQTLALHGFTGVVSGFGWLQTVERLPTFDVTLNYIPFVHKIRKVIGALDQEAAPKNRNFFVAGLAALLGRPSFIVNQQALMWSQQLSKLLGDLFDTSALTVSNSQGQLIELQKTVNSSQTAILQRENLSLKKVLWKVQFELLSSKLTEFQAGVGDDAARNTLRGFLTNEFYKLVSYLIKLREQLATDEEAQNKISQVIYAALLTGAKRLAQYKESTVNESIRLDQEVNIETQGLDEQLSKRVLPLMIIVEDLGQYPDKMKRVNEKLASAKLKHGATDVSAATIEVSVSAKDVLTYVYVQFAMLFNSNASVSNKFVAEEFSKLAKGLGVKVKLSTATPAATPLSTPAATPFFGTTPALTVEQQTPATSPTRLAPSGN